MICKHCGKEFSDEFSYCPYCAEPKPKPDREYSLDENYIREKVRSAKIWSIFGGVLLQLFTLVYMGPVLGLIFGMLFYPMFVQGIIYGIKKRAIEDVTKNSRETVIQKQYMADKTSICPNCGSHNVKVYRKGYDYKVGFWGSIFGVRGSGYAGGFGANNACCRCQNCGNDWETDYDYRLINK